ncbi:SgcJ/EcaC family oxidoreductase [Belnapia sp. T18]|uniref:SgcJ/EcaC family oxidoreductase n=1 Tax=Belnapia arida TaxID=2804533 RepID=A0ABS1U7I4_9PROT|nr:SgcJ/EcaC family oxidoreductase [Belnapia arida]MBL6080645.1 SgcJ/EcaC family oxidoreductase [Belnapia arida]
MTQDDKDEEAIRRIVAEMTDTFNRHDAKAATRMYAPDADFVSARGEAATGLRKIEEKLAAIFAMRAGGAVLTTLDVKVRFVRPDVALAHVLNELGGLVAPDGKKLPAHRELSIRVFVKDNGAWRVAAFHNTMQRPFEAPAQKG